jgi:S-sulfosulfanyl-L-cysteine sulfohydrolase
MDNFLLQALLESTGAQLAFSNGWRFGAPIIPGEVTVNDLYNMIPMNPPISTIELTGCEASEGRADKVFRNIENLLANLGENNV